MKLVVGLGNPGARYQGTRHNIGFEVVEELARRHGVGRPKHDFQGEVLEASVDGEAMRLLRPHTFMNRSGSSVQAARDFFKLGNEELLIVSDDFHLPLGKLRFRVKGSSGGQKGLADILRRLATEEVARLRCGVDEPPEGWDPADYVLGKFRRDEQPLVAETVQRAADCVTLWVREGIGPVMNRYN